MRCPICKKEVAIEGKPDRPFCSQRCRLIDLDHWLSGRYRISTSLTEEERRLAATSGIDSTTGQVPDTEADAKADRD